MSKENGKPHTTWLLCNKWNLSQLSLKNICHNFCFNYAILWIIKHLLARTIQIETNYVFLQADCSFLRYEKSQYEIDSALESTLQVTFHEVNVYQFVYSLHFLYYF